MIPRQKDCMDLDTDVYHQALAQFSQLIQVEERKKMEETTAGNSKKPSELSKQSSRSFEVALQQRIAELTSENLQLQRELSEKKQQQEQQQQREYQLKKQYEILVAQYKKLPVPTYTWRIKKQNFILIDGNEAAQKISANHLDTLIGRTISDIYNDAPDIQQGFWDCISQKRAIKRELWYQFPATDQKKYLALSYVFVPPDLVTVQIDDITQRYETEEALRDSQKRLHNIIATNTDSLVIVDRSGKVRFVNPAAESLFARPAAELIDHFLGLPLGDESTEVAIRRPSGEFIVTEMRVAEITWEKETAYLASLRDITERKQAEEALRESEERFRLLADSAPVLIWMSGTDAQYTFFNNPWLNFTGRTLEQELGQGWIENIHPEDLPSCLDTYRSAFDAQENFQIKYRRRRADGEYRWLFDIGVPRFTPNGDFEGYIGSCIDITEHNELEEALLCIRKAVDSSSEAIGIVDVAGNSLYQNPAFVNLFGYTVEALNVAGGIEVIFQDQEHYRYQTVVSILVSGQSWQGELTIGRRKHQKRQISLHADAIKDQNGKMLGTVITCTEITERKRVERQLQQTNKQLKSSIKQLETSNHEIVMLGEMIEILQCCLSLEEAYQILKIMLPRLFEGMAGGIFRLADNNLVEAATWGTNSESGLSFSAKECWALRRGRSHGIEQISASLPCCQPMLGNPSVSESLCLPMVARGETLGLLHLSVSKKGHLSETRRQLAVTVSEHIAMALANLKLRDRLQQECIRDSLTGLFNRRYLEESLEREIQRAIRAQKPLGIIMIDIDRFKRFNDNFGHEAGDAVLREVSSFLKCSIRSSDIACRYGGEELTLILPEATLEVTQQRAEQIRLGVKRLQVCYRRQSVGTITLSLGIACFPEHGTTGQQLIQIADAALYRAKDEGRDRVVTA